MDTLKPQRPRFQFTLRRLLLGTALVGLLLALFAHRTVDYQNATSAAKSIGELGGTVSWEQNVLENLYEVRTIARITDVRFYSTSDYGEEAHNALSQIPHRFGLHLDGQGFSPDTVADLADIPQLSYLVLNDTKIEEHDIRRFQGLRPDVYLMIGYPGLPEFREFPSTD